CRLHRVLLSFPTRRSSDLPAPRPALSIPNQCKEVIPMARFTLPRDLYHGKGAMEALKTFEGKKAIVCVGGGSMKRFGFLDKAVRSEEHTSELQSRFDLVCR